MANKQIADLDAVSTHANADVIAIQQDTDGVARKGTWTTIKAFLKTYFDTLYAGIAHTASHQPGGADALLLDEDDMSSDSAILGSSQQALKAYVDAAGGGTTTRIEFTRTAAAGSGNQVVTGANFAPKGVIIFASDGSRASWGMGDDSDLDACLNQKGATDFQIQTGTIIRIGSSAGNDMFGGLVSLDADGFTIGWTKYNSGVDITCEAIVWA